MIEQGVFQPIRVTNVSELITS